METKDLRLEYAPSLTIDLRHMGTIDAECEEYLANLLKNASEHDPIKRELCRQAKRDFGWENGLLYDYVLAELMSSISARAGSQFLSSGEWLCGIFTSGTLHPEHIEILLTMIRPDLEMDHDEYTSGKDIWRENENGPCPLPLGQILDILDEAVLKQLTVDVERPIIRNRKRIHQAMQRREPIPDAEIEWENPYPDQCTSDTILYHASEPLDNETIIHSIQSWMNDLKVQPPPPHASVHVFHSGTITDVKLYPIESYLALTDYVCVLGTMPDRFDQISTVMYHITKMDDDGVRNTEMILQYSDHSSMMDDHARSPVPIV